MLTEIPYTKSSSIKFNRCQRYVGLEANSNKTSIKHHCYLFYCCVNFIFLSLSGQMYKKNNLYNFIIHKEKDQKQKITAIGFYQ